MIEIKEKEKCCGCTACYSICPNHCIEMTADAEGFLYPQINKEQCVNCGLCERVCPMIKKPSVSSKERETVVLRTKDRNILLDSTSGGFFTNIAACIIEAGGVVCGAAYDENYKVIHSFLTKENSDELYKFRGSKYVQSNMGDCFARIKKELQSGRKVCFIGTTCQVSGLKAYLGKEYNELLAVDLVCHGVPSPKLWNKYLAYQKKEYNARIRKVSFRNKTYGYHSGTMKIEFEDGKTYFGSARVDYMLKSFFSEIASRPSCYQCPFKSVNRCSDFTLFDSWHAADLVQGLKDDDRGYTNVIIQSDKAKKYMEKLGEYYEIFKADTQKAIALDGIMIENSAVPHKCRNEFYKELDENELTQHIQKFIPVSKKDKLIEASKGVVYRMGIYNLIHRIIRRK